MTRSNPHLMKVLLNKSKTDRQTDSALTRLATVVTTSTWCKLDACVAGNQVSHNPSPFKEKRLRGTRLPCYKGKPKHNCRLQNRSAEETGDIQSIVDYHPTREVLHHHHKFPPPLRTIPFVNLQVPIQTRRGKNTMPP